MDLADEFCGLFSNSRERESPRRKAVASLKLLFKILKLLLQLSDLVF